MEIKTNTVALPLTKITANGKSRDFQEKHANLRISRKMLCICPAVTKKDADEAAKLSFLINNIANATVIIAVNSDLTYAVA